MAKQRDLLRTHEGGALLIDGLVGSTREQLRAAEQRVAWCCTDNLAMSRQEASQHAVAAGRAFTRGETYAVGEYTFELKDRS